MFYIFRGIKKELMKFIKREVNEKSADWGELRRLKRHVVVKKGLPSVPNLVIKSDHGISYTAIFQWKNELRFYLFDGEGRMLHGQSFYQSLQDVYKDLCSKSKKIARYPTPEKEITLSQRSRQLDKSFQQIWVKMVKRFNISKKHREKRPLIKGIIQDEDGIFGTRFERDFIHVPIQSSKLELIFLYCAIYFLLPPSIRQNDDLAEALALKLLMSLKQTKLEVLSKRRKSFKILKKLHPLDSLRPSEVFNILKKITNYYDLSWKTQDFVFLVNISHHLLKTLSRQNLPELFCQLFSMSGNEDFLILGSFLGLPFEKECLIPSEMPRKGILLLFDWIQSYQFSQVLPYLEQEGSLFSVGQMQAIKEALHFQYTNVLNIKLNLADLGIFEITNKSDLVIILSSAIQVFPDGTETEVPFQEVILQPNSTEPLELKSLKIPLDIPIRFRYYIAKSPENTVHPIFKGTLVI